MTPKLQQLRQQQIDIQAEIDALVSAQDIAIWEPRGGNYWVNENGDVVKNPSTEQSKQFGIEYPVKTQAEWASKQMRRFNRLLAYIAEHTVGIPDDIIVYHRSFQTTIEVPCLEHTSMVLYAKTLSGEVSL